VFKKLATCPPDISTTGNVGLDALADAIAERVIAKLRASNEPERLITVPEAARYLGRTPRAVRHLISTGALPVVREGRSVHLDRQELDRWIELRQSRI
jgi:excisionase family DNA binding protein